MSPEPELAVERPEAQRMGFFTDTTVCIGCKACEVACKQWNDLPADGSEFTTGSYDHTGSLGAATWRHVRFVEEMAPSPLGDRGELFALAEEGGTLDGDGEGTRCGGDRGPVPGADGAGTPGDDGDGPLNGAGAATRDVAQAVRDMDRWVFMSDVCKHCTNAGCLDACPTGAIIRTEFETVFIQPEVCNGCGYCIPACPFGVVDRDKIDGRAGKCTLCYDRLSDGLEPACAKSCPTDSIMFGPYEELVEKARGRVLELHERGVESAYLYGAGDEPGEELAGGLGAFFLLTEPPERFGLPAQAESPVQEGVVEATLAAMAAGVIAGAGVALSFVTAKRGAGRRARARGRLRW